MNEHFADRQERETVWLPAGMLRIEPRYQRPLDGARIRAYAANWNDRRCNTLVVNMREDGQVWVIDGQHRLQAFLRRHGPEATLPCTMYYALSPEEEAELFSALNGDRAQPTPLHLFRARVMGGDPEALNILKIVHGLGLGIRLIDSRHGERAGETLALGAIKALQTVYRRSGPDGLNAVLGLIRDTWGLNGSAYESWMLSGVDRFLDRYGEAVDRRAFVAKLSGIDPKTIKGKAGAITSSLGTPRREAVARALAAAYNSGRRSRRLPVGDEGA